MASFLSFVYRRQASAPASFQSPSSSAVVSPERQSSRLSLRNDDYAPRSFLPPGVTSSGSSESAGWVSPGDSSDDERFLSSPFTPEGLKPRKSADSLRRELKLSPRTLDTTMKGKRLSGVAKILAGMDSNPKIIANDVHNDNIRRQQYSDDEEDMILPPPDYLQRRQPTFESSVKSPMVSTSSFYSRSQQDRPVAMSPVLQVGQARTAVGALVALREAANRHPNADSGAADSFPLMESSTDKAQRDTARGNKKQLTNKQSLSLGVLPPRTDLVAEKKDTLETEDENVPYLPINTPVRRAMTEFQRAVSEDDDLYASPSSMQLPADEFMPLSEAARKGMDTSFSSRADLMGQQKRESYDFEPIRSTDGASFSQTSAKSSLLSLGKVDESEEGDYDFNEEEFDGALMARKFRNQQMRKQMQLHQEEEEECFGDFQEAEEEEDYYDSDDYAEEGEHHDCDAIEEHNYDVEESACVDFEEALVRRKTRNQRHEKEAFLLDVVARLRDNLELVTDIENAASSTLAAMGNWFVKTPMDEENLMTGFSGEQRDTLLSSVDSILRELETAQPEEFILSPSKVPVMAVTHDTLTQALFFCRSLIASAIPRAEKSKMVLDLPSDDLQAGQRLFIWKCLPDLHFALGLTTPQSPDTVRGGGTSLFSLPEESGAETPHTSNVSMATSITSAHTPYWRRAPTQQTRPQLILQQDGLQLRHTVEVVSSLLQKLTLACLKLAKLNAEEKGATTSQTYVQACDEIKKIYLQFLAVKKEDARALADAFFLEAQTPQCGILVTREVSLDEDDAKVAAKASQVVALATAMRATTFPEQHERQDRQRYRGADLGRVNLFSPLTEDVKDVPFEYDDLRRQVGSYDRDEDADDEQRDGPSLDDFGSRESEESAWSRRMFHNVSLAANSIRSLRQQEATEQRE